MAASQLSSLDMAQGSGTSQFPTQSFLRQFCRHSNSLQGKEIPAFSQSDLGSKAGGTMGRTWHESELEQKCLGLKIIITCYCADYMPSTILSDLYVMFNSHNTL